MRLILSRKGFDSAAGRVASPIFEDGTLLSLPIPERRSTRTYAEVEAGRWRLGDVVEQLSHGRVMGGWGVHLDPDLLPAAVARAPGWRPSLGQCDAAQGVLRRHGVTVGDLFLFFGWFRDVESGASGLRYRRGSPDRHVLFGWLQAGAVLRPMLDPVPTWAGDHPHVVHPDRRGNTLYVAAERLTLDGVPLDFPGAGVFRRYRDDLCLTASGGSRSVWSLPPWFDPRGGRPPLGGHGKLERWVDAGGALHLHTAPRGQEFVLDMDHYPEASSWLRELIAGG